LYINKHSRCLSTPFFLSISGSLPSIVQGSHAAVFRGGVRMLPDARGVCQHRFSCQSLAHSRRLLKVLMPPFFAAEFVCYQTHKAFVNTVWTCTFWQLCRRLHCPFCASPFSERSNILSNLYAVVNALFLVLNKNYNALFTRK